MPQEIKIGYTYNHKLQACRKAGIIKWEIPAIVIGIENGFIVSELLQDAYDDVLEKNYINAGTKVHTIVNAFNHFEA